MLDSEIISELVITRFKNDFDNYERRRRQRRLGKMLMQENFEYDSLIFHNEALRDRSTIILNLTEHFYKEDIEDFSVKTSNVSSLISTSSYTSSFSDVQKNSVRPNCQTPLSIYNERLDSVQSLRFHDNFLVTKLMHEAKKQQQIIRQTYKALNLCLSSKKFRNSTEYVEAAKILLSAVKKREAVEKERSLLENEFMKLESSCTGFIKLAEINIRLIETTNSLTTSFCAIIQSGSDVFVTEVTQMKQGTLDFKKIIEFNRLSFDFQIQVILYSLNLPVHDSVDDCEKEKMWPLLLLKASKSFKKIFAPKKTRFPFFNLFGVANICIADLKRRNFCLIEMLQTPTIKGNVSLNITCGMECAEDFSGFLTVSSDMDELPTWNRQWCYFSNCALRFWNYPRDQQSCEPKMIIDLNYCVSNIRSVNRDMCARPCTLLVETVRDACIQNESSFNKVVRYYLSTDSEKSMNEWEKKLNYVVISLRKWKCMKYPLHLKI